MYIHEILEWLSEAKLQERTNASSSINDVDDDCIDDHIAETDSAILNSVTLTERIPSAALNPT
jgi:hypothetical protein